MRVRKLELRLIAAALVGCWTLTGALVLLGYRPGGPVDLLVGAAVGVPVAIALAAFAWPPVTRGERAFAAMVWLGLGSILVLVPSIAEVSAQLAGGGIQTLLPSVEAAYPWAIALLGTSLFAGFGVARQRLGGTAMRRPRLVRGVLVAGVMAIVAGSTFTAAAMANELALRDRVSTSSRFGPTDPEREPPDCNAFLGTGSTARIEVHLAAAVDGRSIGTVALSGQRAGTDFRWLAYIATDRQLGLTGEARIGSEAWVREPFEGWREATLAEVIDGSLDAHAFGAAIGAGVRGTAEMHGVAVLEGARARLCRVAIDGAAFREAFPQVEWLVGDADLSRWRGQLDYWVFLDDQVGRVVGTIEGEADSIREGALLATIGVDMVAVDRDRPIRIGPPGG